MELASCRRRYALAFGHGDAWNPDDFLAVRDHRQAVTDLSRNMGVNQDVLQPLGLLEAERTHPVSRFTGGDRKGQPHEVCVEVSDLVAGLERCWIAAAGDGRHNAPTPTLQRKAGEGITARRAGGLDLPEPGIGNEAADGTTLESRRRFGEGSRAPAMSSGRARPLALQERSSSLR